nr:hypothetical protein [Tanacetum cinerariifolium]
MPPISSLLSFMVCGAVDRAIMRLSVRRTTDETFCILAWQLPRVAAMADTCMCSRHFPTKKKSQKKTCGNEQIEVFERHSGTDRVLALLRSNVHELSVPFL